MSTQRLEIPELASSAGTLAYAQCNEGFIKLDAFANLIRVKDRDRTAPPNEIQTLTITGTPTGGTFKLRFFGTEGSTAYQTTATIVYNAAAAAVQSALEALSNVAVGDVVCAGGALPGTPVTVEFKGQYAGIDIEDLSHPEDAFTGGVSPALAVTTTQESAAVGDRYLVATSATDAWSAEDGNIAIYAGSGVWYFFAPWEGLLMYVEDEDALLRYTGTAWKPFKSQVTMSLTQSAGAITPALTANVFNVTALSANLTVNAPTGTAEDGDVIVFRFAQNGTGGWTHTFNAVFAFGTDYTLAMLPTTASAKYEAEFRYHGSDAKWRCTGISRGF